MGVVYKASQLVLDRTVALKVLNRDVVKDDTSIKRFLYEAKAMASLKSPHTITLYDFGATSSGLLFYTMDLLEGHPLSNIIRKQAPLDYTRAAALILQAAESLDEAHEHGILHRDIKPDNLFITRDRKGNEHLVVLDFGIAKLVGDQSMESLTRTGAICGTPAYLSPEQAMGNKASAASDLYSLGIVFYEMLAGTTPFRASTPMKLLLQHLQEEPEPVTLKNPKAVVPKALEQFILTCLAKKPEERFASVPEFRDALERTLKSARQSPKTGKLPLLDTTDQGLRTVKEEDWSALETMASEEVLPIPETPISGSDRPPQDGQGTAAYENSEQTEALADPGQPETVMIDQTRLRTDDVKAIHQAGPGRLLVGGLITVCLALLAAIVLLVARPWESAVTAPETSGKTSGERQVPDKPEESPKKSSSEPGAPITDIVGTTTERVDTRQEDIISEVVDAPDTIAPLDSSTVSPTDLADHEVQSLDLDTSAEITDADARQDAPGQSNIEQDVQPESSKNEVPATNKNPSLPPQDNNSKTRSTAAEKKPTSSGKIHSAVKKNNDRSKQESRSKGSSDTMTKTTKNPEDASSSGNVKTRIRKLPKEDTSPQQPDHKPEKTKGFGGRIKKLPQTEP
jgi:serine/threonine protein kinase